MPICVTTFFSRATSVMRRICSNISFSEVISCFMPKMRTGRPSIRSTIAVIRIQRRLPFAVVMRASSGTVRWIKGEHRTN